MSRGGRGGFAMRGGKQRIGGQEVNWDYDPDLVIETKPQDDFPKMDIPRTRPPSAREKASVRHTRTFQQLMRKGPFYTVIGDKVRVGKSKARADATFNPFEGMPSYTAKYKPKVRELPTFGTGKFVLNFFPEELWDTIDRSRKTKLAAGGKKSKDKRPAKLDELGDVDEDGEKKDAEDEDADRADRGDDDEEEDPEENPEDDFSDDDSEMGGDYNAENYFDDGEGDDDDGGGDGDGGFD